jgi:CubicO group peptidase (beta-lactamase class C family)
MLTRRSSRYTLLSIAVTPVLCACAPGPTAVAQTTTHSAAIDAFRDRLQADVAADNVGSIAAAVVVGDSIVWTEAFGWADRDKHIRADAHTIYRLGSVSKSFTAIVLAQLVDRGVIALDDPVERYFPEIRGLAGPLPGATPITFRHLASHTAGIIREPMLIGAASGPIAEWEAKVLASIPTTSFDAPPGARYSYSNIGYGILGLALSRAAHVPFMKLVEDGIFTPLGMASSTFIITDRLRPALSVGYLNSAGGAIDAATPAAEHAGRGYKVPNGGVYSTVTDLARYLGALSGAKRPVTSDSMRLAMMTKQTPESGPNSYGLGLFILAPPGALRTVSHGGGVAGYTCEIAFDPESKVGVILLRNYNTGRTPLDPIANETVRAVVAERNAAGLRKPQ